MYPTQNDIDAAVAALDSITGNDAEREHEDADRILLEFVPEEVAAAWRRASDRNDGFHFA